MIARARIWLALALGLLLVTPVVATTEPLPVLESARGELLVDTGQPWLVWADEHSPPDTWPLLHLPVNRTPLESWAPPEVVAALDRAIPTYGDGTPGTWLEGTSAPYTGISVSTWIARAHARDAEAARRVRRGRPEPSRTALIYDSGVAATEGRIASEPEPGLANLYFARAFRVDDPADFVALQLEVEFSAGVIVWINGRPVARHHIAPGHAEHGNAATPYWLPDHVNQTMYRRWQITWLGIDPEMLRPGDNVISVAIYKRPSGGRRALYFDLRLEGHRHAGYTKNPYLQHLGQNRVTVMWETNLPGFSYVEYGTDPNDLTRVAVSAQISSPHHEVVLRPLEAETRYYYRVRTIAASGDLVPPSPVASFVSGTPPGRPFSFMAYGDNRTQSEIHTRLIRQMWNDAVASDARFVLSTGDLVTNASPWREWQNEFFEPALPLMGRFPYFTTLGNHEGNHESYYHYLDLPGNEAWYSFVNGDAEFFALNSSADYSPGSPQATWLERALAASSTRWKIAFFHHPPFACTPVRKPGDLGVQEFVVPLLARYGVDLVLLGHDHLYGRSVDVDGVRYVITGGGGAPRYPAEPDEINEICLREYHYCMVDVSEDALRLRAIALGGAVLDDFVITP